VSVSIVALLSRVDNTITAGRQPAVSSAHSRDVSVSSSKVALFTVVDDAVTASGQSAVSSAAVGLSIGERGITVSDTVVALFVNSSSSGKGFECGMVFPSSVSALAVRELREVINQLLQKLVGDRGTSRSLEKDGDSESSSASGGIVEQLQFKIKSSATDQVFGGGVEDESLQNILLTLVCESLSSVGSKRTSEEVASVEQPGGSQRIVIFEVWSGIHASISVHWWGDVDRRLGATRT